MSERILVDAEKLHALSIEFAANRAQSRPGRRGMAAPLTATVCYCEHDLPMKGNKP